MIDQLIKKYKRNKYKEQCSTLTSLVEERDKKRIVLPYNTHCLTINNCLKKNGYDVVFESSMNLQKGLGSTKDPIPDNEKSGVYEVTCPSCNESYVGQTRRRFKNRWQEHERECKKSNALSYSSSVAEHCNIHKHFFNVIDNTQILKVVTKSHHIDAWESYFISIREPSLNKEDGPFQSSLFGVLPTVEHHS